MALHNHDSREERLQETALLSSKLSHIKQIVYNRLNTITLALTVLRRWIEIVEISKILETRSFQILILYRQQITELFRINRFIQLLQKRACKVEWQ